MAAINYNNKKFKVAGTDDEDVTVFKYFQSGNLVWGEYSGGSVKKGSLIAKADDNDVLSMHYQHLNTNLEFKLGKCVSSPKILEDGRIEIHEIYESIGVDPVSKGEITLIEIVD